ncbi:MAG TPA: IS1 family transposase [Tepidisphaeraceae bacterium]|nr:IS1 family transposase [Tepidisphaeraceae bacterium]
MNKLTTEDRAQILTALVEGNSMASTARMYGVSKITILRLLADAGTVALNYHDTVVCRLSTKRVQVDEIWSFCHSKDKNVQQKNWGKGYGDTWTWVAMDADSKLAINWHVGGRDAGSGRPFVADLASRLNDRIQLTSDGWQVYRDAVARAFGTEIDYAMLIKEYANERQGHARYSPPECVSCRAVVEVGSPDRKHINTSFIERQNLSMRMGMRRFTRLTNAFSKRPENHEYAIAIHYFHYNFIRKHMTIKTTPAVMSGVANHEWTMVEFVQMMEREEKRRGGRITDYKIAASKRRES